MYPGVSLSFFTSVYFYLASQLQSAAQSSCSPLARSGVRTEGHEGDELRGGRGLFGSRPTSYSSHNPEIKKLKLVDNKSQNDVATRLGTGSVLGSMIKIPTDNRI